MHPVFFFPTYGFPFLKGGNTSVALQNFFFALSLFLGWDGNKTSCSQRLIGALEMCVSRTHSMLGCQGKLKEKPAGVTGSGKEGGVYISVLFPAPAQLPLFVLPSSLGQVPRSFELTNYCYINREAPVQILTCKEEQNLLLIHASVIFKLWGGV